MLDQRLVERLAERTQHRVDFPVELDLPADLGAVGKRLKAFYAGIAAASLAVEPHPVRRCLVRGELAAQLFECIGLVAVRAISLKSISGRDMSAPRQAYYLGLQ